MQRPGLPLTFQATVVGDPTAGIQEVWVVYTVEDGQPAVFVATIAEAGGRFLPRKTVIFEIRAENSRDIVYTEALQTDYPGQARLTLPPQAVRGYVLSASYGGPGLEDPRYLPSSGSAALDVIYDFDGFFPPVENLPILNKVNAGRAIPIKFSLSSGHGLEVLNGLPEVRWISCDTYVPTADVTETIYATESYLSYDPLEDQYVYVWKTNKFWAGSCRQFVLRLADGKEYTANFKFK